MTDTTTIANGWYGTGLTHAEMALHERLGGHDHYHVFAVQDQGGTQESVHGKDGKFTLGAALELALHMWRADAVFQTGNIDLAEQEFGERLYDLISDNVAPGWNAIWVIPCDDPCTFEETFAKSWTEWGKPVPICMNCAKVFVDTEAGICGTCNDDIQRGFAVEHIRKGFYDANDLALVDMTKEQAEQYLRNQQIRDLADRYRNDPGVLRGALAAITS